MSDFFSFPLHIYSEMELLNHKLVLFFFFSKKLHTMFHSGYTNLHFHQQCMRLPFSPHHHQELLSLVFLMTASLTAVRWYLMMGFIRIFLMISDDEHLLLCLLAICISSLEKCLFSSTAYFVTELWFVCFFFFWLLNYINYLYTSDINPLSDIWFAALY